MFKVHHAVPLVAWPVETYKPVEGRQFQQVAEVAAGSIEQVFTLTQNVGEGSWVVQPWAVVTVPGRQACRSTSVGDIIETASGEAFVVAPLGLEQISALDSVETTERDKVRHLPRLWIRSSRWREMKPNSGSQGGGDE